MVKNTKGGSSHKKLARKKEDEAKIVKVDIDVDFKYNMIVLIDKNIGNCFTAKLMHYNPIDKKELSKYEGELKVLHQRGRNARSIFNKTQSRLALVSLAEFKLPGSAIGYVEELLLIDHLDAYLNNKLIDKETYSKLSEYMTSSIEDVKEKDDMGGFEFDRSKPVDDQKVKEEEDIDIDDI